MMSSAGAGKAKIAAKDNPKLPPPGNASTSAADTNPLNINGPAFDPDMFTQKLIREASLAQLMTQESELVRQIGSLDSDMQTLVYENYNKFIAATDTIQKMRVDFRSMEDKMDRLAAKMGNVTEFSGQISETLRERRSRISQLSATNALLKKLQFLLELPAKLKEHLAEDDLATGVKYYLQAQRVLVQYENLPSFHGIKKDCDQIMVQLRERLTARLSQADTNPDSLAECVDLLLKLDESPEILFDTYLATAKKKLDESLSLLEKQCRLASGHSLPCASVDRPSDAYEAVMDILEFVDTACNGFISDLCLVIASYSDIFINRSEPPLLEKTANAKLVAFVTGLNSTFLGHLRSRFKLEKKLEDTDLRVRALDRFHRRYQAMGRILPSVDFSRPSLDVVLEASEAQCHLVLDHLKISLQDSLVRTRQSLVTAPRKKATLDSEPGEAELSELNTTLLADIGEKLREQLANLQCFIDPELTFAVKSYFRARFCHHMVREGVVVAFFAHIMKVAENFCEDSEKTTPPPLLLLLSRTCFDLQLSTIHYLMNATDEQFFINDRSGLTSAAKVNGQIRSISQKLLDHYVKVQGGVLSQMLRKSVETRDWLNAVEPRAVRAVMKRIVEETTTIDRQVGKLYEEGSRKVRSSDSSRRTRHSAAQSKGARSSAWSVGHAQLDTSLASNIQKMFSEKIEIFTSVEFSRVSVLTGIVKIALKTLLECVRLRSFSKFGFQQMQVDCHYLHLYLWRFVSDENLVSFLLDEVMTSAVHRCPEAIAMDQSVVDMICDQC